LMKGLQRVLSTAVLFCFMLLGGEAYAQSVFLKDGSIVEGKIVTENDSFLTIKEGAEKRNIKRSDIIRTVYNNDYKNRVNVVLMDGRIIKGYVVEESKDCYIVRKYLDSTKELKLEKSKINGILKDDVAIKKDQPEDDTGDDPGESAAPSPVVISTDKSVYAPKENIIVKYSNMPGGRYDWISLAKKDSPDDNYETYYYTSRRTEGELVFKKGLPAPGDYEVRVYLDWAMGSYKVSKRYPFKIKGK